MRYWLANCFLDFDDKLLKTVIDFIEYRITPILTSSAQTLLQIIERRVRPPHFSASLAGIANLIGAAQILA